MRLWDVDRVIVSSNENPMYLDFWPIVAYAYRTLFPGTEVTLAFLTRRHENDPFVDQLRQHGNVRLVYPTVMIPEATQAKLARYYTAGHLTNEVVYIDDIDVIPISRDWHLNKVAARSPGRMLFIGEELFEKENPGQCPASMMTGEGKLFADLFRIFPHEASHTIGHWLFRFREFAHIPHANVFSHAYHAAGDNPTSQERLGEERFSDEVLIKELRAKRPIPYTNVVRDYVTGHDTIDRSYWANFDLRKLQAGKYVTAHTGRPYAHYKTGNDAIARHIQATYEGGPLPDPLVRTPQVDPDVLPAFKKVLEKICKSYPQGAKVLQFGSDLSTDHLTRYFDVMCVTDDPEEVNRFAATYIFASRDTWPGILDKYKRGLAVATTHHAAISAGPGIDEIFIRGES